MAEKEFNWKEEFLKAEISQEELKEHYRNAIIRMNVELEARDLGMADPDLAIKLADFSACSFDEESETIIGIREILMDLAARKPYLFGPQINQGIPPPPKLKDGFLETVQRELGFKKS